MLRHRVGVHLDMWVFLFVALEVDFEVPLGGEAVPADVALEWPLTRVGAQVDLQGTVAPKDLGAEPALVFEERLIGGTLCFEGSDIWWLAFSLLGQGRQGVQILCSCSNVGQGAREDRVSRGRLR